MISFACSGCGKQVLVKDEIVPSSHRSRDLGLRVARVPADKPDK
jgi:hypothetical protein